MRFGADAIFSSGGLYFVRGFFSIFHLIHLRFWLPPVLKQPAQCMFHRWYLYRVFLCPRQQCAEQAVITIKDKINLPAMC